MKQVRKYITFLLKLYMLLGMVLGSSAHSVESASENTENGNVVEKNMEAIPETPASEFLTIKMERKKLLSRVIREVVLQ